LLRRSWSSFCRVVLSEFWMTHSTSDLTRETNWHRTIFPFFFKFLRQRMMSELLWLKQSLKFNTCKGEKKEDEFYLADASFILIQSHKFWTFNHDPLLELYNFMFINVASFFSFLFFFLGK
jgi:hypothetical protein